MTSKTIRYWTAGISVASGILALGDKAVAFPGVPGWLTSCWPFVLAGAAIFNNVAHILITPDPATPTPVNSGNLGQPVEIPVFVGGQPAGTVTGYVSQLPSPQAFRAPLGVPQKPSV